MLNIYHTVHSHLDAYWLQTFEEYYYGNGTNNFHRWVNVKRLYSDAITSLTTNVERTVLFSEISFFSLWWSESSEQDRQKFKNLVNQGRIEFITGGWVQPDEPLTYYEDLIDNIVLGHQFLKNFLQVGVNVVSCNDDFSHSAGASSLYSSMGFNARIIERFGDDRRKSLIQNKKMEFLWEPEVNIGVIKDSIFTHLQRRHEQKEWEKQNLNVNNCNNLNTQLSSFKPILTEIGDGVRDDKILYYSGDDWTVLDEQFFKKQDIAISFYKDNPCLGLQMQYSNTSNYFLKKLEAGLKNEKIQWPIYRTDFMTYLYGGYWTGYYSSQPSNKIIIRQGTRYLHAVRNFFTKFLLLNQNINTQNNVEGPLDQNNIIKTLQKFEQEMAMHHHHDGITSTSKYRVHDIANTRMKTSIKFINQVENDMIQQYAKFESKFCNSNKYLSCNYLDNDKCLGLLQNKEEEYIVTIFNPSQQKEDIIELNIPKQVDYQVFDEQDHLVKSEVICIVAKENYCSLFIQQELQAYSMNFFLFKKKPILTDIKDLSKIEFQNQKSFEIIIDSLNKISAEPSLDNFVLTECTQEDKQTCSYYHFQIKYQGLLEQCHAVIYIEGNNRIICSGKYVMQNNPQSKYQFSKPVSILYQKGSLITIIKIEYNNYVTTILKLIPKILHNGVKIETYLDLNGVSQKQDFMMMIQSKNITTNEEFYTDSNGLYMLKRNFNVQEDLVYQKENAFYVSGNVYPITSICYVEDTSTGTRMAVIADRAQGVTSLESGALNMFIERKTSSDPFGVDEELSRIEKQRYHYTVLFTTKENYGYERIVQQNQEQIYLFNIAVQNKQQQQQQCPPPKMRQQRKKFSYSQDIKVIARPQGNNQFLVRIENINSAKTINITHFDSDNINYVMSTIAGSRLIETSTIEEYALNGAMTLKELIKNKWHWNKTDQDAYKDINNYDTTPKQGLELKPFQIRMFLLSVNAKQFFDPFKNQIQCNTDCNKCINNVNNCVKQGNGDDNPDENLPLWLITEKQKLKQWKQILEETQAQLDQQANQQKEQQSQIQQDNVKLEQDKKTLESAQQKLDDQKKSQEEVKKNQEQKQKSLDDEQKSLEALKKTLEQTQQMQDDIKKQQDQQAQVLVEKQKKLDEKQQKLEEKQKKIEELQTKAEDIQTKLQIEKTLLDQEKLSISQESNKLQDQKAQLLTREQQLQSDAQALQLEKKKIQEFQNNSNNEEKKSNDRKNILLYFGYAFLFIYLIYFRIKQNKNDIRPIVNQTAI